MKWYFFILAFVAIIFGILSGETKTFSQLTIQFLLVAIFLK